MLLFNTFWLDILFNHPYINSLTADPPPPLMDWSLFILIIVWIFHGCDLWIKYRMKVDMIGLTFIRPDWCDRGDFCEKAERYRGDDFKQGRRTEWCEGHKWWSDMTELIKVVVVILNRGERWFHLLPVSMPVSVRQRLEATNLFPDFLAFESSPKGFITEEITFRA